MLALHRLMAQGVRRSAVKMTPVCPTASAQPATRSLTQATPMRQLWSRARSPVLLRRSQVWLVHTRLTSSANEAVKKTAGERRQEMVEKGKSGWSKLKELWRQYGMVAVGTYFSMYFTVLGSIYVAIEQGWVSTKRTSRSEGENGEANADFNVVTATNKVVTWAEDMGIAKHLDLQRVNAKTGSFVIAWVATKFTEPLRLAVTLAITPRIARLVGRAPKLPKAPKV
ncbi:hypothetical protein Poli38472_003063 [Pythium oligandrum]|uniref:DUF1279 domain-containing protein n=1 Tax=Pythium oligandrum TaxID=41045 RepID=A0A8K1C653_PYTOL|nr:hypothetical protein Poli38472_003063 [Pythium oligandrum]|eukprot:TMW57138.1 hypothetical protein Poli38472_003063 [Pythium oligandrum]